MPKLEGRLSSQVCPAQSRESRSSKDTKITQVQFTGCRSDRLWNAAVAAVVYETRAKAKPKVVGLAADAELTLTLVKEAGLDSPIAIALSGWFAKRVCGRILRVRPLGGFFARQVPGSYLFKKIHPPLNFLGGCQYPCSLPFQLAQLHAQNPLKILH